MDTQAAAPGRRLIGVTFNIDDRTRREQEIADINQQLREQNALVQQLNEALDGLASKESLCLCNRRMLMQLGDAGCRHAERCGHPLSFLVVALKAAESVRSEVAALNFDALVDRVDHALYRAKGTARNAVYNVDGNNLSLFAAE